ncbi:hypothetical protein [Streptomyces luteogriseus]|uniref:hypothetical protein n=1 Tax=Streptomyces luteogriseus TaxID=68233 RepID=UPI00379DEF2A
MTVRWNQIAARTARPPKQKTQQLAQLRWKTSAVRTPQVASTPFESAYLARAPTWWEERADHAWVASGLLRHIALFHTVTKPYSLKYRPHGLGWKFALRYEHDAPMDYEALLAHLIHPAWGMPLQATRAHCVCRPWDCDKGAERNRWCILDTGAGRRGEIGIHFGRARADRNTEHVVRATGRGMLRRLQEHYNARAHAR